MKKLLLATVVCVAACFSSIKAQEDPKVIKTEPQLSDIYEVLETMNIHLFRFDLSEYLQDVYSVKLYIDEYENGKWVKEAGSSHFGKNRESLNNVPENVREDFRKYKKIPEGKDEWDNIKELAVYITKRNDSTAVLSINIPDGMKTGKPMKLHPIGEEKLYLYAPRPFKFNATPQQDTVNIPLIMYGSYWVDTKYNVIRMCGEKEIDPEMKAEILQNIPHYFVVGIKLEKVIKE